METLKKYFPYFLKAMGAAALFTAFGGLMADFPESIPTSLCMALLGVVLLFPDFTKEKIPLDKHKTAVYWGIVIALIMGAESFSGLLPKTPYLQYIKSENVEWSEETKRYETSTDSITLTFVPTNTQDAKAYYIDNKNISLDEVRVEHPLSLQEGENILQLISIDKKDRKNIQNMTIYYTSEAMVQKEKEETAKRLEEERIAKEAEIKKQKEDEKAQLKIDLENGIEAYKQGQPLWDEWKLAETINDGKESTDQAIKSLATRLQASAESFQAQDYPKQRRQYAEEKGKKLWENNFEISVSGSSSDIITFRHYNFGDNGNIKEFHSAIRSQLIALRFSQVRYKWYDGSEYQYFNLDSLPDREIKGVK